LQTKNTSIDRLQIFIKKSKGRTDRYTQLAQRFLPLLTNYLTTYRPEIYFDVDLKGQKYTAHSIRKFLHRCAVDSGILKKVTPHTLRHRYATHLLENGIGLRYMQELLAHSKPVIATICTHVAKKHLLNIESPLDTIILSLNKIDEVE
jgi:site-specific recombinase XerD